MLTSVPLSTHCFMSTFDGTNENDAAGWTPSHPNAALAMMNWNVYYFKDHGKIWFWGKSRRGEYGRKLSCERSYKYVEEDFQESRIREQKRANEQRKVNADTKRGWGARWCRKRWEESRGTDENSEMRRGEEDGGTDYCGRYGEEKEHKRGWGEGERGEDKKLEWRRGSLEKERGEERTAEIISCQMKQKQNSITL